jgi:DNA helicase IV
MDGEAVAQRAGSDREWTYGHIVVDEAQELTAMDWRMLIRRCPSRSFTIVGDVAQTAAMGGTRRWRDTMDPLFGAGRWDLDELTINYRNPQEVSNTASEFAAREGLYISTINAVRTLPDSLARIEIDDAELLATAVAHHVFDLVSQFVSADGTGRVAVIAPQGRIPALRESIHERLCEGLELDEFARLQAQQSWDEQVSVCDTETVKGLEYDAVVVVQPAQIEEEAPARIVAASDLYVAMTRPTQRLVIVRTHDDADQLPL